MREARPFPVEARAPQRQIRMIERALAPPIRRDPPPLPPFFYSIPTLGVGLQIHDSTLFTDGSQTLAEGHDKATNCVKMCMFTVQSLPFMYIVNFACL